MELKNGQLNSVPHLSFPMADPYRLSIRSLFVKEKTDGFSSAYVLSIEEH